MSPERIVITISGGNVDTVFASNPKMEIYIVDYDNLHADPNHDCDSAISSISLRNFGSIIAVQNESYPGLTRLAAKTQR
jgi:hypothetical protein